MSRDQDRRMLEWAGGEPAHQCPRDDGSPVCSQSLCKESTRSINTTTYGQHVSCGSCEPHGEDEIPRHSLTHQADVAMVPSQEDYHLCTTCTRPTEYHSRFPIETSVRSNRLDVRPCHFSVSQSLSGSILGRPLCYQTSWSTASLSLLEARSRGGSHECISAELVGYPGVRTPTMEPNYWQSPGKGSEGGSLSDHRNTITAYSGLVPDSVGATDRLSNDATKGQDHYALSQLHGNGEVRSSTTIASRLEGIRERLKSKKVSNQAIELILHSWQNKTNANYDSIWKSWEAYCQSKDTCPFLADVSDILDFLAVKFHSGLTYRSLNCYRSALSSAVLPIEGFKVGQHPLVARLMNGVFNARPPRPKYADTWDVSRVLALLKSWGERTKPFL